MIKLLDLVDNCCVSNILHYLIHSYENTPFYYNIFDLKTSLYLFHISIHVLDKHTYTLRDRYITPVFIYTSTFN